MEDTSWMLRGSCVGTDPDSFYRQAEFGLAKRVCGDCEVKKVCLQYALDHMDDEDDDPAARGVGAYGIWGGTSPRERWRMTGRRWSAAA